MVSCEPDFQDALQYVATVKSRFRDNKRVYDEFLYALRSFRDGVLSKGEMCEVVATLFADEEDLLRGFSIFLPDQEQPALYTHAVAAKMTGCAIR